MSTSENQKIAQDMEDPEMDLALRELLVADYIVFLFSLDTYMRYLETAGIPEENDPVFKEGLMLLRLAERQHLEAIGDFLKANVNKTSVRMLDAALRFVPNASGATQRALRIRTVLSRGGTTTARAVFGTSIKARKEVLESIEASMMEDPDAALSKFSALVLRNKRLEKWIDKAADVSVPGSAPVNPVQAGVNSTIDTTASMLETRLQKGGQDPASEAAGRSSDKQADDLATVQNQATDAAKKAISKAGERDEPVTRSEAIGIAAAAVAAATTDPDNNRNVPSQLQGLDPEQLTAATTEGRVLIAAGAGSGKTATLSSRVAYLVRDKGVDPSRIMVFCFNRKAADEMKERIAGKVGDDVADQMSLDTMHATFRRFIKDYGTPEEKASVTTWLMGGDRDKGSRAPSPGSMAGYMARIWKECFGEDPPRGTGNKIQRWMMDNITPDQAKQMARDDEDPQAAAKAATWYEWFLGFKGVLPKWQPPCRDQKSQKQWGDFLSRWRDNGRARLGDFSDMILIFRDILRRNPGAKKQIQSQYDHILVDEAQDLNQAQHEILAALSEHITDGSDGKSLFVVGDEIQSVNSFAGARPDLFTQFGNREGWKVRSIATNYRCLPEIIEVANRLMDVHPRGLPMVSRPDPKKPRGQASIVFRTPDSHASGAIATIDAVAQDVEAGEDISSHAVLTRTNLEMNDFETACIVRGIPYARRGGSSFLKSPETQTVMSYVDLLVGQDFGRMQQSLIKVFNKPNRFFISPDESARIITEVVNRRARRLGVSNKNVNPLDLFDSEGISTFIDVMDTYRRWQGWKIQATRETLMEMGRALEGLRTTAAEGKTVGPDGTPKAYTTKDLINDILAIPGVPEKRGAQPPSLRDDLMPMRLTDEEEEDDLLETGAIKEKPIGNVEFLYRIAEPTGKDGDPSNPANFKSYLDMLEERGKDLRVDVGAWEREQKKLPPSKRQRPPAITLSTVHSVKGAQWPNVTVVMSEGVFPHRLAMAGKDIPADATSYKDREKRLEFLTERQLAYVAMTRAAKSLTVLSPSVNAYGKSAAIPLFVTEAGLVPGQNVPGKNDPTPDNPPSVPGDVQPRTVLAWIADMNQSKESHENPDAFTSIYDRSGNHD